MDNWFLNLRDDRERIKAVTNQVSLWSVFTNTFAKHEPEPGDEIPQLATALGECWQGVLSKRYPDQQINVQVSDEEDGTYGPTVTFWGHG
ncbi:hypothetical protein ABZ820_29355 [Streptomyces diacarni]|uniref:hypothetical protein n=1 Tax=Streptomyces diacarni TaxID=2800381 RepID=UPI0033F71B61